MNDSVLPQKPLSFLGSDGYETYVIDENTIGVRPKWISVEDRLPPDGQTVLIWSAGYIYQGWYEKTSLICGDFYDKDTCLIIENVTHWMPLPEPPKE
jgi:hypothetical protein